MFIYVFTVHEGHEIISISIFITDHKTNIIFDLVLSEKRFIRLILAKIIGLYMITLILKALGAFFQCYSIIYMQSNPWYYYTAKSGVKLLCVHDI